MSFVCLFVVPLPVVVLVFIWCAHQVNSLAHFSLQHAPPPRAKSCLPVVGSLRFLTATWSFTRSELPRDPPSRLFSGVSFRLGLRSIVTISGPEARKWLFNGPDLDFYKGYEAFGASAPVRTPSGAEDPHWAGYVIRRLKPLLSGKALSDRVPCLAAGFRHRLDQLGGSDTIDPFVSIGLVMHDSTLRHLGTSELVSSDALLSRYVQCVEAVAGHIGSPWTAVPFGIPTPSSLKKLIGGTRLFFLFRSLVNHRRRIGAHHDDTLHSLLDRGDGILAVVVFMTSVGIAAQLGVAMAGPWVLYHLGANPVWLSRVREEAVAASRKSGCHGMVEEGLASLDLEAWDAGFPVTFACVREAMRLSMAATAARYHPGPEASPLPGVTQTYNFADVHLDPEVFADPHTFDPARFLKPREEHLRVPFGFIGWGGGRHPCAGRRLAELQLKMLVAFFVTRFDVDAFRIGKQGEETKNIDVERLHDAFLAPIPKDIRLRYRKRTGSQPDQVLSTSFS